MESVLTLAAVATAAFTGITAYLIWQHHQRDGPLVNVSKTQTSDENLALHLLIDPENRGRYRITKVRVRSPRDARIARPNMKSDGAGGWLFEGHEELATAVRFHETDHEYWIVVNPAQHEIELDLRVSVSLITSRWVRRSQRVKVSVD